MPKIHPAAVGGDQNRINRDRQIGKDWSAAPEQTSAFQKDSDRLSSPNHRLSIKTAQPTAPVDPPPPNEGYE